MVIRKSPAKKPASRAKRRERKAAPEQTIWDRLAALGAKIPADELDRYPSDTAEHFDRYHVEKMRKS